MSAPAPSPAREGEAGPTVGDTVRRGLLGGLAAFGIVAAVCIAVGMIEWAGSGGRYHAWTWVKVGFLYLLSSCGVAIRLLLAGQGRASQELWRVPLLAGAALILWLVARASRRAMDRARDGRSAFAGAAAAALGFAIPGAGVAWLANLRFPSGLSLQLFVSPVRWQAVVLVPLVAAAGALLGVYVARRRRWAEGSAAGARAVAWTEGGARMFAAALVLAFVGFLVLAALRPAQTSAYVDEVRGWGRGGAFAVTHHILLLPDQSVWLLAPSMGGTTTGRYRTGPSSIGGITVTIRHVTVRPPDGGSARRRRLDPAALLFLLVPALATIFGGRFAAAGSGSLTGRVRDGVGAGVVFALLVSAAALATRALVPVPPEWITRIAVAAAMPSTALLALGWGVSGGAVGALTATWRPGQRAQEPGVPAPD